VRLLALVAILVACHARTVHPRDRLLAVLPGSTNVVVIADGTALARHAGRGALDAVRPYVPASMGCVLDIAPGAETAALAMAHDGVVIALVVRSLPKPCAALSHYEPDLWVATVGDASPVDDPGASVLGAPAWARARPYLADAPLAVVAPHVIATARTEPPEVWIAVDGTPDPVLARAWRAANLEVVAHAGQVVARSHAPGDADLAALVSETLRAIIAPPAAAPNAIDVHCAPDGLIVACSGHSVVVRSLPAALRELAKAADRPVVADGDIVGVRLRADALGLRAGDVILGYDAHRVTSGDELARLAASASTAGTLAVRRGEIDAGVDVRQQE